jgi:hypothetical protein
VGLWWWCQPKCHPPRPTVLHTVSNVARTPVLPFTHVRPFDRLPAWPGPVRVQPRALTLQTSTHVVRALNALPLVRILEILPAGGAGWRAARCGLRITHNINDHLKSSNTPHFLHRRGLLSKAVRRQGGDSQRQCNGMAVAGIIATWDSQRQCSIVTVAGINATWDSQRQCSLPPPPCPSSAIVCIGRANLTIQR